MHHARKQRCSQPQVGVLLVLDYMGAARAATVADALHAQLQHKDTIMFCSLSHAVVPGKFRLRLSRSLGNYTNLRVGHKAAAVCSIASIQTPMFIITDNDEALRLPCAAFLQCMMVMVARRSATTWHTTCTPSC